MPRAVNDETLELIRRFEGCRLQPYHDAKGLLTIGTGHLIRAGEDFSAGISQTQAEALLARDLGSAEHSVLRNIARTLNDNQFGALVSFTFNLGGAALQRSTLRRKVNAGCDDEVAAEFLKWNRIGPQISRGLERRRKAEAALYNS